MNPIISKHMQLLHPSNIQDGIYYIDKTGRTEFSGILPDTTHSFSGKPLKSKRGLKFEYLQLNPITEVTEKGFKYKNIQTRLTEEVIFDKPQTMSGLVLIVKNGFSQIFMPNLSYDAFMEYIKNQRGITNQKTP